MESIAKQTPQYTYLFSFLSIYELFYEKIEDGREYSDKEAREVFDSLGRVREGGIFYEHRQDVYHAVRDMCMSMGCGPNIATFYRKVKR